jgi:hypothetical protein
MAVSSTPSSPAVDSPSINEKLDELVDPGGNLWVIRAVNEYRTQAEEARAGRMIANRRNRDMYLGRQDFSSKIEGQSRNVLPKVSTAVEQMCAFVKKGLVTFGDWFSVTVDNQLEEIITGEDIAKILQAFLNNLWSGNDSKTSFPLIISDGVKNGLLESLIILKVHGGLKKCRRYKVQKQVQTDETGAASYGEPDVQMEEYDEWRLRIDLVRPEDYYPDPTGANLYEIHRVERDLHEVMEMAENGIYDKDAVKMLVDTDFKRPEDEIRNDRAKAQEQTTTPSFRKRVVLDEFWGTLLKEDGTVAHRNVVVVIANGKYLIRPPEPNPFWHQESPFVVAPLVRVPWSTWHKAMYDEATDLNIAINEMFNLMLDGGLAAVWGVKQLRIEDLEDPSQVSGGVKQGATLAVKNTIPPGVKVLETVTEGNVPQDAMAIFEFLNREFNGASLTNEIKLGNLPTKQVRSTEVIEASQSQATTLDGMISDVEDAVISRALHKAWLTLLQEADGIPQDVLMGLVDKKTATIITQATPQERFGLFAGMCSFKVDGISATMARAKDFQKIMALLQAISANPLLLQAFMIKFSPDRTLTHMLHMLNINPATIQKTPEEMAQQQAEMARTQAVQPITTNQKANANGAGEPGMPSQINQIQAPTTGMAPNA